MRPCSSKETVLESYQTRKWSQIFSLTPVYLLQVCYGMNTGYPAILTPQLSENCSEFKITSIEESWIVSMDNILTPVVCILSGFVQQMFGPKKVLMLGCLPYVLGWSFAAFANSVGYLYASRLLVGIGHAIITTTVYTVETASKEMRGAYSLLEAVLRCFGCLVIYALGFAFRWNTIATYSPIIPVAAFFFTMVIPESPVFLVCKGKIAQANDALKFLYGSNYNIKEELEIIQENISKQKQKCNSSSTGEVTVWNSFKNKMKQIKVPQIYKPLLIVMLMSVIQQFSGMSILRAYVVKIFDNIFHDQPKPEERNNTIIVSNVTNSTSSCTGDSVSNEAYIAAIVLGFFRLIASLLLSNLLLKFSRRSMYFVSSLMTVASLIAFAGFSHILAELELSEPVKTGLKWSSLAAACFLVFAVQLGVQTLPFLLSGELFPSEVRALCKGLTRSFSCILIVLSLTLFPVLESLLTFHGTFYLFAAILVLSVPVIYFTMPETKDLGLEQIQHYFTKQKTIFYIDLEPENNNNVDEKFV